MHMESISNINEDGERLNRNEDDERMDRNEADERRNRNEDDERMNRNERASQIKPRNCLDSRQPLIVFRFVDFQPTARQR